ncbi:hypothetical protein LY78DRAFT_301054 [Colletotrichum sublineola]|nr:hypothetical protein LY78DRAFT_301054 [Colletotrichum sublineola]
MQNSRQGLSYHILQSCLGFNLIVPCCEVPRGSSASRICAEASIPSGALSRGLLGDSVCSVVQYYSHIHVRLEIFPCQCVMELYLSYSEEEEGTKGRVSKRMRRNFSRGRIRNVDRTHAPRQYRLVMQMDSSVTTAVVHSGLAKQNGRQTMHSQPS